MSVNDPTETEFWVDRWNQGQTAFHLDRVNPVLLKVFDSLAIPRGSSVLVPLCGKTHDLVWLRDQGLNVTGIEVSALAIKDFAVEQGIEFDKSPCSSGVLWTSENLRIFEGDFFAVTADELGTVELVYDRAALIALPEPARKAYVDHLDRIAGNARQSLIITLEYDQSEMQGPPFSVSYDEVERLFGGKFEVMPISTKDVLSDIPRFKEAGLTRLHEPVYRLEPLK